MPESPHVGQRFSLVYQRESELIPDSSRMRLRLSRALYAACQSDEIRCTVSELIPSEIGVPAIEYPAHRAYKWDDFFAVSNIGVVLDMVTLTKTVLEDRGRSRTWAEIKDTIERIFVETQVTYRVDKHGCVRYVADEAYEANRASTISTLTGERHSAALANIMAIDAAMSMSPMDGRQAIRASFDAAENLFKQMSRPNRLTKQFVISDAIPWIEQLYEADDHAKSSATKTAHSFGQWVDGAHYYRHEAGQPEPHQPPEDLAITIVSQGISFVRWLASMDANLNGTRDTDD